MEPTEDQPKSAGQLLTRTETDDEPFDRLEIGVDDIKDDDVLVGLASLWCINVGCQVMYRCLSICNPKGTQMKLAMAIMLPIRAVCALLFGVLGCVCDVLVAVLLLPCSYCMVQDIENPMRSMIICHGWGVRAVYKKHARRLEGEIVPDAKGRKDVYWKIVEEYKVWDRSSVWRKFECCSSQCLHAVCCATARKGKILSMGCDCLLGPNLGESTPGHKHAMRAWGTASDLRGSAQKKKNSEKEKKKKKKKNKGFDVKEAPLMSKSESERESQRPRIHQPQQQQRRYNRHHLIGDSGIKSITPIVTPKNEARPYVDANSPLHHDDDDDDDDDDDHDNDHTSTSLTGLRMNFSRGSFRLLPPPSDSIKSSILTLICASKAFLLFRYSIAIRWSISSGASLNNFASSSRDVGYLESRSSAVS
uniref:Uncharacterized protein n=1 Tax=Lotharella globosa TaxID=91324 RepID=A0A6V3PET4_9EUKA